MKDTELFNALTLIGDDLIREAEAHEFKANRRLPFLKALAAAACFCAAAAFLAYSLPRLLAAPSADGRSAQLPAATASPDKAAPLFSPAKDGEPLSVSGEYSFIVWNEGAALSPVTRGGTVVASCSSASESFEFYGGAELPDSLDSDCSLIDGTTYIVADSSRGNDCFYSTYTYAGDSGSVIFVTYFCTPEQEHESEGRSYLLSSCGGEHVVLGISSDAEENTVYSAQLVLNVDAKDAAASACSVVMRGRAISDGLYSAAPDDKLTVVIRGADGSQIAGQRRASIDRLTVEIESVGEISRERFLKAVSSIIDSLTASLPDR